MNYHNLIFQPGDVLAKVVEGSTMPGLPKRPAAMRMDIDADGIITGLF